MTLHCTLSSLWEGWSDERDFHKSRVHAKLLIGPKGKYYQPVNACFGITSRAGLTII